MKNRLLSLIPAKIKDDPILSAFVKLAGDSAVYTLGAAVIGLGNFVLIPLYTKYLSIADFAAYTLLDIAIVILVLITQLGFGVSYLKWYGNLESYNRGELLGSTISVTTSASILVGGLLSIFLASPFGHQWFHTTSPAIALVILPIIILENIQAILLTDLRARRYAVAYSASSVVDLSVIVLASFWFIVVQKDGLLGLFLGRFIGDLAVVIFLSIFCIASTHLRIVKSLIVSMVIFGIPLVLGSGIELLIDASGRYFLSKYSSIEQVSYYGIAVKIASIFQVLITRPFGIAWGGLMFQIVKWPRARFIYSKIAEYIFVISLTAAAVISIFTPTLFSIFATPAYDPAKAVFPLILLVRALSIMAYPVAIGLYLGNRSKWVALVYSIGFGINIIVNFILVPKYGLFGSAWGWLAAWVFIIGCMAYMGQRYFPLTYRWKSYLLPLMAYGLFLIGGKQFVAHNLSHDWLIRGGVAIAIIMSVAIAILYDLRLTHKNNIIDLRANQE